jgi:hypothetical protein
VIVCSNGARYVREVIGLFNQGIRPDAVTIGGETFYFVANADPGLVKHENMHVEQQARYCPWYLKWAPLRVRAWAGLLNGYGAAYYKEHITNGYIGNKFEIEARSVQ